MRYGAYALSVVGLLAAGVGALAQSGIGVGETARPSPIPQSLPHDTSRPVGTLLTAQTDYPRGGTIVFHFNVSNPTNSSIHYDFSTAQQFDVAVTDPNGVVVWRWSQNRAFEQALTAIDLRPGETKHYTAVWYTKDTPSLSAGTYTATATLTPTVRPAVRGGLLVNPDMDPNNVGMATQGRVERGVVVQVNVTPRVSASTKFSISPQ